MLHQEVFLKLSDSVCATNEGLFLMLPWLAARRQGLDNFSGLPCGNVIVAPCSSSSAHNSGCHHGREECHAWLPPGRISNPTPCAAWQRCLKTNCILSSKAKYFVTVWAWSLEPNHYVYSRSWATWWRLLWFNHWLCCIWFILHMSKEDEKWNFKVSGCAGCESAQIICFKQKTCNTNCFDLIAGLGVVAHIRTEKFLLRQILLQSK